MKVNAKLLEHQIDKYVRQEITKQELGVWAMKIYLDLMKGEYVELEKLSVYHFIRTISTCHIKPDDMADEYPCTEDEILNIAKILQGKGEFCYTFRIRICENVYKKEKYKDRLEQFKILIEVFDSLGKGKISSSAKDKLIEYSAREDYEIQSLIDLIERHIKYIIVENYDEEENMFNFRQNVGIYTGGSDINEMTFLPDLQKLMECAIGKRDFRISIIYKQGIPNITLVL